MSSSTPTNPDIRAESDPIAAWKMRLDKQSSLGLENSDGTSVVYQTIEVFPAAEDVAMIRGTPHYFCDNRSIITLSPTEQRAKVRFGSTAVPQRDDPSTLDIRAYADIKDLGRLSNPVTDLSSIPDDYKRGDGLGGDYESLTSDFVSLITWLSETEYKELPLTRHSGQARVSHWVLRREDWRIRGSRSLYKCGEPRPNPPPVSYKTMLLSDCRTSPSVLQMTTKSRAA